LINSLGFCDDAVGYQSDHDGAPTRTIHLEDPWVGGDATCHRHCGSFLGKLSNTDVVDNEVAHSGAHEDGQPHRGGYHNQPRLTLYRDHACGKASNSGTKNHPAMTADTDSSHPACRDGHRDHAHIGGRNNLALIVITVRFRR
jgi:hypothetical protein